MNSEVKHKEIYLVNKENIWSNSNVAVFSGESDSESQGCLLHITDESLYKRCSQTCAGRRRTSDVVHGSENDLWTMLTSIVHAYLSSTLTKFRFKVGYSTINGRLRAPTRQTCHLQNIILCNRMKWTLLGYDWVGSVCLLSFPRGFSLGPFSKVLAVNKKPC